MNSVFNEQILADKLSKLNSTQQCIETLSHWCIFHRSKAEQVVATWDKQFHSAELAQKVPLLYLANDILQNSKRKGNEFVKEFWKVLPLALKVVVDKGDDHGKNVVSRLVNIWDERKVFGHRAQNLNDVMLGKEPPVPLELGKKRSRSVRIVKRDSRSIKTKLSIGGTAEKIVSAFHLILSEQSNEDEEMSKCKSAVHRVRKMEDDVDLALTKAGKDPKRKSLAKELEEEENHIRHCIEKLKAVEANRLALVSQLREALHEQESSLENVRTQIQVAEAQAEEAGNMRKHLDDENYTSDSTPSSRHNDKSAQATRKTAAAIAAEVADKLAASSSSQYIMTSVLSTFAAEAAKSAGVTTSSASSSSLQVPPVNMAKNSMPKLEPPLSDANVLMPAHPSNPPTNNSYQTVLRLSHPSMQGETPVSQTQYHSLPNPHSQQYMQPGAIVNSFAYGNVPHLPPGPPPPAAPSYMVNPMPPLTHQSLQMTQAQPVTMVHQPAAIIQQQQQPLQLPQQSQAHPGYRSVAPVQPPVMVYYSHPHHSQ